VFDNTDFNCVCTNYLILFLESRNNLKKVVNSMSRFSLGTNTHTIKDFRIAVRQLENMTPVTSITKHGLIYKT